MSDITDRIAKAPRAWTIKYAHSEIEPDFICLEKSDARRFADHYVGSRVVRIALVELEEGE